MKIGVVSDTHNKINHVEKIIDIFNKNKVDHVIHTGDITQSKTLSRFSRLNCPLTAVYGNNDLEEGGLEEVSLQYNFNLQKPPYILTLEKKEIAILHEPYGIEELIKGSSLDLILHGHTHRFRDEEISGVKVFNPGECAGMLKGKNAVGIIKLEKLSSTRIFF